MVGIADRSWLLGFFDRKLLIRAIKLLRAYQALIKEDRADGEDLIIYFRIFSKVLLDRKRGF